MDKRFEGKTCPFCKTPFKEDDVIVVCSVCERPHHLSCWQENKGCSTVGCTGTIKETIGSFPAQNAVAGPPPVSASEIQNTSETKGETPPHRFETLFESEPNAIQGNIPVLIEKQTLIIDHQSGSLMARCIFRSLTDKPIAAMLVDVLCTDVWGKQSEKVEGFQFLDLKTKRESTFGQTKPIPIPDKTTREINVVIKKVLYSDRTIVDASEDVLVLPKQETLESFFGNAELAKEYARETTERAKYTTVEGKNYWRCTCGAVNRSEESSCYRCNSDMKQLLGLLDPDLISGNLEAFIEEKRLEAEREQAEREEQIRQAEERMRLAREEKERQEKEAAERKAEKRRQKKAKWKKVLKRTGIITVAVLLLGFLIYAAGWHIIPYARYQNACKALEAQSFDKAYDTFTALGSFRDSSDKAIDTLYQKGVYLMNRGSYLDAAAEFERVPDYQDSSEQAAYCRNEAAYLDAEALFEAGDYKAAADAFTGLAEYSDSAERANASNYLYAQELLESGEYENAHTVFKALPGYEDSKNLADESYYRLALQLFDEKKYGEAYPYFKRVSPYKDSQNLANESEYLYAIERFEAGDYEKAVTAFKIVKDYKDAAERLPEAEYQYALALKAESNWKAAASVFGELGDYQDSASQYKETYYQYGLQLLSKKSFKDAATVFDALGSYQESKTKLNEAKYGYVLAHKNNNDTTTYSYLKDLKAVNYKDSKDIYSELFSWRIKLKAFNASEDDYNTVSSSISRYCSYCHFEFQLLGGPPGEKVTLTHRVYWPDGSVSYSSWYWENIGRFNSFGAQWEDGLYTTPSNAKTGTLTVKIYIQSTGELIGEASIKIG